jgi:hypothetical protein
MHGDPTELKTRGNPSHGLHERDFARSDGFDHENRTRGHVQRGRGDDGELSWLAARTDDQQVAAGEGAHGFVRLATDQEQARGESGSLLADEFAGVLQCLGGIDRRFDVMFRGKRDGVNDPQTASSPAGDLDGAAHHGLVVPAADRGGD